MKTILDDSMELSFIIFKLIEYETLSELTELQKEQMKLTAIACFGDDFKDATLEDFLEETYEGNCELWQVCGKNNPEEHLYDAWIVNVDTAVVFHAGTSKDTEVGMIQYSFDPIYEETEENLILAKALLEAFDTRPEIDYLPDGAAKAYQDTLKNVKREDRD